MLSSKRPLDLTQFAQNMPPGVIYNSPGGRFVFGSRYSDTVPYVVPPGGEAAISPEDVPNIPISTTAFAFTFDLSNTEDLQAYQVILNALACQWYQLIYRERIFDKEKKTMTVYLEVLERHRKIPVIDAYTSMINKLNNKEPAPIA